MTFDWKSYVQLADELINYPRIVSIEEAYLRTSISRSYYGVFCIARNILIRRNVNIPFADTHKFVRLKYQNSPDKVEKKIGDSLKRLWKDRKNADYDDKAHVDKKRAETAYLLSVSSLSNLDTLSLP